jgi:Trypsin-like peptidase domain
MRRLRRSLTTLKPPRSPTTAFINGRGQRAGKRRRLPVRQVVAGEVQAADANPLLAAVVGDDVAHDNVAVRAWPFNRWAARPAHLAADYNWTMSHVSFLSAGEEASGNSAIFPICKLKDDRLDFIGTGFFVSTNGLFITAKHNLQKRSGEPEEGPLYVVHFYEQGRYFVRSIVRASFANDSDFAVGAVQGMTSVHTGESLKSKILSLSLHVPAAGETISTYAYPETDMKYSGSPSGSTSGINFVSNWYHGTVTDLYPHGMGFITSAALAADMRSLGGCSGGPVFSEHGGGGAVGINSAGIEDDVNIVSLTSAVLDVAFFDITIEQDNHDHVTIQQLINLGFILVVTTQ